MDLGQHVCCASCPYGLGKATTLLAIALSVMPYPTACLLSYHRGSNDLTYATALGTSSSCDTACLGNPQESCGGREALSVYSVPGFNKLGCYADSWDRMLPNQLQTSPLMTPAKCSVLAADGGYTVFGVQNGNQCWCVGWLGMSFTSAGCTRLCCVALYCVVLPRLVPCSQNQEVIIPG